MTDKQSVVIIGGGPAGLTAAWELIKDGGADKYDVTVLEGTREFGGISRTVKHNGNRMDIGGHRFFSKDERIMDWWKTVLPLQGAPSYDDKKLGRDHDMEPGGPDPETEDKVMLKRHRVSRIFWNRHFFDYPISLSPNTLKAMGFKLTMVAGFSYLKSMFHKLPEDNLENFYINRFGRKLYSMFFEGYTEKLWGRHPSQISADWGATRAGLSDHGRAQERLPEAAAQEALQRGGRDLADRGVLVSEVRSRPAVGDRRVQLRGRRRQGADRRQGGRGPPDRWCRVFPWCTRIPRATAPSFPATSSSPRCRSRTWSTPSTRPAPIPRLLIPSPPRPI